MKKILHKCFTKNELKRIVNSPPYGLQYSYTALIALITIIPALFLLNKIGSYLWQGVVGLAVYIAVDILVFVNSGCQNIKKVTIIYAVQLLCGYFSGLVSGYFYLNINHLFNIWVFALIATPIICIVCFVRMKAYLKRTSLGKSKYGLFEVVILSVCAVYFGSKIITSKKSSESEVDFIFALVFFAIALISSIFILFFIKWLVLRYFEKDYITQETMIKIQTRDRLNQNKLGL